MTIKKAVQAINGAGVLLVYPIKNLRNPPSLWHYFFPRSEMSWDWSEEADERVVDLWHLRTELSENSNVLYAKWFRGRATFFSRPVFMCLLELLRSHAAEEGLTGDALALYEELLSESPQTSKMLRVTLELEGRLYESTFARAQRQLWQRLLIVGRGEVDDGALPSLAFGATRVLAEELWDEARTLSTQQALSEWEKTIPEASEFHQFLKRLQKR